MDHEAEYNNRALVPEHPGSIAGWVRDGWRVALVFDGHGPAKRAVEQLADVDVPATMVEEITGAPSESSVSVTVGRLDHGFISESLKLAVLTEADLTGQRGVSTKDMRRMPSRSSTYSTNGKAAVSDRKGVPVRASRRAAGSKASRMPSPHERASPPWWISSRMTSVRAASVLARWSIGLLATCA